MPQIYEELGLTKEEATDVFIAIARCIWEKKSQVETIDTAGLEDENKRVFAAYYVGHFNGLTVGMVKPHAAQLESSFIGKIIALLNNGREDLAREEIMKNL